MPKVLILVVEDDPPTADVIRCMLEAERYGVLVARTALEARSLIERNRPDLLILDRMLPDKDGLELCRELKSRPETRLLPILFLTSRKSLSDKVLGLKMGGDDYLDKPFQLEELAARVESLLRRTRVSDPGSVVLGLGPISINLDSRSARLGDRDLSLTPKEFDLLQAFLERPDRVLGRRFLLSHVWGYGRDVEITTKAVDVMVMGLRRKLGKWGSRIETVTGHGYRLRSPEEK